LENGGFKEPNVSIDQPSTIVISRSPSRERHHLGKFILVIDFHHFLAMLRAKDARSGQMTDQIASDGLSDVICDRSRNPTAHFVCFQTAPVVEHSGSPRALDEMEADDISGRPVTCT
jgi:hypothetical protein